MTKYIPPISLLLAADQSSYIAGLHKYRAGKVSEWCKLFAEATAGAARKAERLAEEIESQEQEWLDREQGPGATGDAGILRRLNQRKWGRVWECDELLDLVEDFERTVATGADLRRGAARTPIVRGPGGWITSGSSSPATSDGE